MRTPVRCSNTVRTSNGSGAPPEMHATTRLRSGRSTSASAAIAMNSVGTPKNIVGGLRRHAARIAFISKRGNSTSSAPISTEKSSTAVSAKTWKNGSTAIVRCGAGKSTPICLRCCSALAVRLRWLSIAALGVPVVPPVYCRTARSSGASVTTSGAARLRASRAKVICATGPEAGMRACSARLNSRQPSAFGQGRISAIGQTMTWRNAVSAAASTTLPWNSAISGTAIATAPESTSRCLTSRAV